MKTTAVTALMVCLIMIFSCASADAQNNSYVRGFLGAAFLDDSDVSDSSGTATVEYDPGILVGGAIGYDIGMPRIELEVAYHFNDIDSVSATGQSMDAGDEITALSFMVNGYIDFENTTAFTPYGYAGIGWALLDMNDFTISGIHFGNDDDSVFAFQLGAGIGYNVTDTVIIDLGYRYFKTDDPSFDEIDSEYGGHEVFGGIRYTLK